MHTGIHFWQHQRACQSTCYWTLIRIFLFFPFFPSYLLPSILSSSSSISYSFPPSRYANSPFLLPPFLFFLPPSPRFPLPQHLHPLFSFLTFKLTFFLSLFAPFSPTLCTVQAAHRILTKANISYVNSDNKEAKEEKGKKETIAVRERKMLKCGNNSCFDFLSNPRSYERSAARERGKIYTATRCK